MKSVSNQDSESDFYTAAAHLINCPCAETEKALIEFNEIQNNIVISKGIDDRPASALTAADKRPAITATSFNMVTRNENWQQLNTTAGGFFKEGSILGTMDQMTKE